MFQRRHMQEIAKALKVSNASMTTINEFCGMLEKHNPNFDLDRFMVAVGRRDDSG